MTVIDYQEMTSPEIGRIGQPKNGTIKRLCAMVRENRPLQYVLQSCAVDEKGKPDPMIGLVFTPEDLQSLFDILKNHLN